MERVTFLFVSPLFLLIFVSEQDALEDFTRATHKRAQSVHQMVAMFASNGSEKGEEGGDGKAGGTPNGKKTTPNSMKTTRCLTRSKGVNGLSKLDWDGAGMR